MNMSQFAGGVFPLPWPGYDLLNVGEVLRSAERFRSDRQMIERIIGYERAHKNRKGVLVPLVNWNS